MPKVNCDEGPLNELRNAVLKKHGKIYGALKIEVNKALSEQAYTILNEVKTEGESY